jgi:hypothetical protein
VAKHKIAKRTSSKRVTQGSLLTNSERSQIKRIGEPIALLLGRIGFSPDALTLVGFGQLGDRSGHPHRWHAL